MSLHRASTSCADPDRTIDDMDRQMTAIPIKNAFMGSAADLQ
jgi:hypothetical protein